ncbi:MAG TPA: helix-turn-helix domain-containing protein [Methyloceanibacter sp.]|nr:helix-turn-helix domain-containing protein [Methyloceanibacter sp.]
MAQPVDVAVGRRLRSRRKELGVSQAEMARDLDISTKKLGEYEKGQDRMKARHIFLAARYLGVSVGYFFHDGGAARVERAVDQDLDLVSQGLQLMRVFYAIPSSEERSELIQLARHASGEAASGRQTQGRAAR